MSGTSHPGNQPTNPSGQQGYPQYPQPPQPPYNSPPAYPPYPQQPPYQPQYYPPPTQPPKKGGTGRILLIIGIVAVVLIFSCVGLCTAAGFGAQFLGTAIGTKASQLATQVTTEVVDAGPAATVSSFCLAESHQDYATAYTALSLSLQQQYTQSQFIQDSQQQDSARGTISNCALQGLPTVNGSTATVSVTIARTLTPTVGSSGTTGPIATSDATGQITLVEDSSGNWTISNIASSLNLL